MKNMKLKFEIKVWFLLLSICSLYSCQKDKLIVNDDKESMAKDYLSKIASNQNEKIKSNIIEISKNIDFINPIEEKNIYGNKIIIYKLDSYLIKKGNYKNTYHFISFVFSENEKIIDCSIYTLRTNKTSEIVSENIGKVINGEKSNFSGEVIKNNVLTRFKSSQFFNDLGELYKKIELEGRYNKFTNSSSKEANMGSSENCSYWYLVTTTLYPDGTSTQNSTFAYAICGPCNNGGQATEVLYADCDGNSGGGGGGGSNPTDNSESPVEETVVLEDNATTQTKIYKWYCINGGGGVFQVCSFEKGYLKKVNNPNPNLRLEFDDFKHLKCAIVGIYNSDVTSMEELYNNSTVGKYHAKMQLGINLRWDVNGAGNTAFYEPIKTFNIHD